MLTFKREITNNKVFSLALIGRRKVLSKCLVGVKVTSRTASEYVTILQELIHKIYNQCSKEGKEQEKADLSHETLMAETSLLNDSNFERS